MPEGDLQWEFSEAVRTKARRLSEPSLTGSKQPGNEMDPREDLWANSVFIPGPPGPEDEQDFGVTTHRDSPSEVNSSSLVQKPEQSPHKRTYQACMPCRRRKVMCDIPFKDNHSNPPCVRCQRENKECFFAATRRKRKIGVRLDGQESGDQNESAQAIAQTTQGDRVLMDYLTRDMPEMKNSSDNSEKVNANEGSSPRAEAPWKFEDDFLKPNWSENDEMWYLPPGAAFFQNVNEKTSHRPRMV